MKLSAIAASVFGIWTAGVAVVAGEAPPVPAGKVTPLFDGTTMAGWEGDLSKWQAKDGTIVGGAPGVQQAHNDFLATIAEFENFVLRLKFKLGGASGFINSGVQIRSQRVPNDAEMAGYQCDLGDPAWWGSVYDESRRNRVMMPSDMAAVNKVLHRGEWNDYVIRAKGRRITTWINGELAADYVEADGSIATRGKIGLQIHGGGQVVAEFKDITIETLPDTPPFLGAPEPPPQATPSPLTPEQARPTFSLPPDFSIELVAAESPGIGKFITTAWDHHGRLWTMTALEYPVDANESAEQSKALFANGGRDKVLVYEVENRGGNGKPLAYAAEPKVFAEGLAIPLGMVPYKDGVIVQNGPTISLHRDTNNDGKADSREVLLEGVGTQDSHLFLHGFTRAPGGWIYTAQGAFNESNIRDRAGDVTHFKFCKLGRFRADGSDFQTVAAGLNNIWGFVISADGQIFGQEANDLGYPVTEMQVGDNFPGIGNDRLKPYAPVRPVAVKDFTMGGTGLSGLAMAEDLGAWPAPYGRTIGGKGSAMFYLANPITNRIQAVLGTQVGRHWQFTRMPDFLVSSDPWFRPIHIDFGPDGCLYIVDWYNKIISHNEVPRNHPDRDKTRGRIWRVRHAKQQPRFVPDVTTLNDMELLGYNSPTRLLQRLREEEIEDRPSFAGRTAAIRAKLGPGEWRLQPLADEPAKLLNYIPESDGSYDAEFDRYMARAALEKQPEKVRQLLDSPEAAKLPVSALVLASLSLEPRESATRVAKLLPRLERAPNDEEMLRMFEFSNEPDVRDAVDKMLAKASVVEAVLRIRTRIDMAPLLPRLTESCRGLLKTRTELALRAVAALSLKSLEADVAAMAPEGPLVLPWLKALRAVGSNRSEIFLRYLQSADPAVKDEAAAALASAPDKLLSLWPQLSALQRRQTLDRLSATNAGAAGLVTAVKSGLIPKDELDASVLERLQVVLGPNNAALNELLAGMGSLFKPVLVLDGRDESWVDADLTLDGAFTVETWIRLEPGITNADGILAAPGQFDINFHGGHLRVWAGSGVNDLIAARKAMGAGVWTHVAVTRTANGQFSLYLNGELDQADGKVDARRFEHLAIGRTHGAGGTAAALTEYRVWNVCRTEADIRRNFDRSLPEGTPGLTKVFSGEAWGPLKGGARIVKTLSTPPIMTNEQAAAMDERFARFKALAEKPGDAAKGRTVAAVCLACHKIGDAGGQIGPNLSGAGAMGVEAVLRNILTPNAAMEAGYRIFRIELTDGSVKEGFLAAQSDDAVVLRLPGMDDQRIPQAQIKKAAFTDRSLMPEGLAESLTPEQFTDLFAYLKTLR